MNFKLGYKIAFQVTLLLFSLWLIQYHAQPPQFEHATASVLPIAVASEPTLTRAIAPKIQSPQPTAPPADPASSALAATSLTPPAPPPKPELVTHLYTVQAGDSLTKIFHRFKIPLSQLAELLEVDLSVLALDTIQPGLEVLIEQEKASKSLSRLELSPSQATRIIFYRQDDSGFEFKEITQQGTWETILIEGKIHENFLQSAKIAGLYTEEAHFASQLLGHRIDFRRDIRKGDTFQVLTERQFIDQKPTGLYKIKTANIYNKGRLTSANWFQSSYYDAQGRSLTQAFLRYPFKGQYRLSSPFNPKRRHPITRLIRPHNGTDFALPPGTPVLSTADGVISRVVRNKYAGLYIEILHNQRYHTRYLHLKKALVRKGDRVKRGQKIALSGNSGWSTGPHLHYELHAEGRPINPMTAKVPVAAPLSSHEKKKFRLTRNRYQQEIEQRKFFYAEASSDGSKKP